MRSATSLMGRSAVGEERDELDGGNDAPLALLDGWNEAPLVVPMGVHAGTRPADAHSCGNYAGMRPAYAQ